MAKESEAVLKVPTMAKKRIAYIAGGVGLTLGEVVNRMSLKIVKGMEPELEELTQAMLDGDEVRIREAQAKVLGKLAIEE